MIQRDPEKPILKITLLATSVLIVMTTAMISPALPAMQADFSAQANAALLVRLVLTLPALFIALIAPGAGYIVDRVGRKKVLTISAVLYGLAGAYGYFAPTLSTLLFSRAILGLAVGGLMTSVSTLIADYYAGEDRANFMGTQAGVMGLGGTLFVTIGGLMANSSWRAPFLLYALAFVVLPFIILALYEPAAEEQCEEPPNPTADPAECAAVVHHAAAPENKPTPLKLILFILLVTAWVQIVFFFVPVQLPFYLRELTGANAGQSGLAIAVITFCYAMASLQYGRISAHLDHIQVLTLGFAVIGAGLVLIAVAGGWAAILLGLLLGGAGLGLMVPNLNVWLANETPVAVRGRALGGFTTALFLGQFLSPIISQPVSAAVGAAGAFLSAGLLLLAIAPLSFATRRQLRLLTA